MNAQQATIIAFEALNRFAKRVTDANYERYMGIMSVDDFFIDLASATRTLQEELVEYNEYASSLKEMV